jgi:protein-L-isoaspartate O-methyltransferase
LGITTADGMIKKDMHDKFRQINKYIEIVAGIIKSATLSESISLVDMGSGKGYLTFALYDYIVNTLKINAKITGIELRNELVEKCNMIASKAGFSELSFHTGTIEKVEIPPSDILIALHACDTATDEAIYRGIKSDVKIIICAPCCHKQIRKQINPTNELKEITRHGILEERMAEILTDTFRALILEYYGYKTKVFEFISTEHTPKNVLIVGIKSEEKTIHRNETLEKIKNLKDLFGIEFHYLEKLFGLI